MHSGAIFRAQILNFVPTMVRVTSQDPDASPSRLWPALAARIFVKLVQKNRFRHDSDVESSKKCDFCLQKSHFLGSGRYPNDVAEVPAGTNRTLRVKLGF